MSQSKIVEVDGFIVQRSPGIHPVNFIYSAWEKTGLKDDKQPRHSTATKLPGSPEWLGRIGTRPLPEAVNALPVGDERFKGAVAHRQAQMREAHRLIFRAFPHLASLSQSDVRPKGNGNVETTEVGA